MIPRRLAPHTYALARIVFGVTLTTAGLLKFGLLGMSAVPLGSLAGVAAVIEVVVGPLVTIGYLARPAAFVASGLMAAAYFIGHQAHGVLPVQNQGIPAVLLCFGFLHIAARGAGIWSLDPNPEKKHVHSCE